MLLPLLQPCQPDPWKPQDHHQPTGQHLMHLSCILMPSTSSARALGTLGSLLVLLQKQLRNTELHSWAPPWPWASRKNRSCFLLWFSGWVVLRCLPQNSEGPRVQSQWPRAVSSQKMHPFLGFFIFLVSLRIPWHHFYINLSGRAQTNYQEKLHKIWPPGYISH